MLKSLCISVIKASLNMANIAVFMKGWQALVLHKMQDYRRTVSLASEGGADRNNGRTARSRSALRYRNSALPSIASLRTITCTHAMKFCRARGLWY